MPRPSVPSGRFSAWMIEPLERRRLLATFAVTTTADSGAGSLRQAILNADANPGADTITFSIGGGIRTIQPSSALPDVSGPTTIDATTQPGFGVTPVIELRGDLLVGAGANAGLQITGSNCLIKGLVINRFFEGISLRGINNAVEGCYIGTGITGFNALPNAGGGIFIAETSTGNRIGVGPGGSTSARNVISGNTGPGVIVQGSDNVVTGNYIGVTADGASPLGNFGFVFGGGGVYVSGGARNVIGAPGAARRNVISANGGGITVEAADATLIQNNYVGTNASGSVLALGGNNFSGIYLLSGCTKTHIGGPGAGNVVSGNRGSGISIDAVAPASSSTLIDDNFIGTDATGTIAIPNFNDFNPLADGSGILDNLGVNTQIIANVISGNASWGILSRNPASMTIRGNLIGLSSDGNSRLGNASGGVNLSAPTAAFFSGAIIGGTGLGQSNTISGNDGPGILLNSGGGTTIQGNFIGTNAAGTAALRNLVGGVVITNSGQNTIGGVTASARNLISGNINYGLRITGGGSSVNIIRGNWIGLRSDGIAAVPNSGYGLAIDGGAFSNPVGGNTPAAGNVISGNTNAGVLLKYPAFGNLYKTTA